MFGSKLCSGFLTLSWSDSSFQVDPERKVLAEKMIFPEFSD
jgi:hypothetical protein